MNGNERPRRTPEIGRIGNAIPPARPASSVPGVRASASDCAERGFSGGVVYRSKSATVPTPPSAQMLTIAFDPGVMLESSLIAWLRMRAPVAPNG
jgi:hypothetical protein